MKNCILISIILLACILLISCSNSKDSITPEIIKNIKSMTDNNKYVSINDIKEESGYLSIFVEFLFEPESILQVQSFTDAICEDCYRIFKNHDIDKSINVWGYRLKDKDLTIMYGKTHYNRHPRTAHRSNVQAISSIIIIIIKIKPRCSFI